MDAAFLLEWLNLLLRWSHMIVGIAWIGASFYFIWLDNHLQPPLDPADVTRGIGGEVWAVHGGGFYVARKFKVAPEKLPPHLHWFMWEAYTTLITGFFLLCLVYYYGAEVALIDPSVMALGKPEAIAIGLGFLVLGWLVYDGLCRSPLGEDDAVLGGLLAIFCAGSAWALCHLFSGRGAYIHFGAMLGTIMVLNVFFVIIPGQRELVKAKQEGRVPDPKYGLKGRQRSVHNTYFTLPVVFAMLSTHYATAYAHADAWLVLASFMAAGALIRQFFVLWHSGGRAWWMLGVAALVLIGVFAWIKPRAPAPVAAPAAAAGAASMPAPQAAAASANLPVPDSAALMPLVAKHCAICHSAHPQLMGAAPKGVLLDTVEQLDAHKALIGRQVGVLRVMPPGNLTQLSEDERALIARWAGQ